MPSISGKGGAVTFGGGAATGKVLRWQLRLTGKYVEDTAMGDLWTSQVQLTNQWEAEFEAEMPTGTSWDWFPSLIGTDAAIALKRLTGDTNPVFSDTGAVTNVDLNVQFDQIVTYTITVQGNAGDAPTFDTTPAS